MSIFTTIAINSATSSRKKSLWRKHFVAGFYSNAAPLYELNPEPFSKFIEPKVFIFCGTSKKFSRYKNKGLEDNSMMKQKCTFAHVFKKSSIFLLISNKTSTLIPLYFFNIEHITKFDSYHLHDFGVGMSRDEKNSSRPNVPKICPVGTSRVLNKSLRKNFSHFRSSSRRPEVFVPSRDIPILEVSGPIREKKF